MTVKVKKWNRSTKSATQIYPIIIPDLTPVAHEEVTTDERHVLRPTRRNLMNEFSTGEH